MKILFYKIIILVLTISLNACMLEQVICTAADFFLSERGSEAHNRTEHAGQSHKHDSNDHESNFCCDNNLTLYISSRSPSPADLFKLIDLSPQVNLAALEVEAAAKYSLCFSSFFKPPPHPREKDKYALCSLLHAPPRFDSDSVIQISGQQCPRFLLPINRPVV